MANRTARVRLRGLPPGLLMNRLDEQAQEQIESRERQEVGRMPPRDEVAERGAYRVNGPGTNLCIPAYCLNACFWEGSKDKRLGRTTAWAVSVSDDLDLGTTEYKIDSRPARLTRGTIVIRHRPHLRVWEGDLIINFDDEYIAPDAVRESLRIAGIKKGVLDYRPSAPKKPGPYGRFEIVSFEMVE